MFRLLILVLLLLAVVVPPASAQTAPVPLVSVNQDPALALLGDANGAKWLLGLGDWGLSFKSDNENTNKLNGVADTTFGDRTYRAKMRITNEGNLWIAGRVQQKMPRVALYRDAHFNGAANGIPTDVPWDGTEEDERGMHTAGTEIITIPYPGVWLIEAQVISDHNPAGSRQFDCRIDSSGHKVAHASVEAVTDTGMPTIFHVSRSQRFEAGTRLRCVYTQYTGGANQLKGDNIPGEATHISVTMLSS